MRHQNASTDIRAPHKFNRYWKLRWFRQRVLALLLSDLLALALAWRVAGHLNQFYLPIPAQLVWWVWLGLPSLFWVFATVTILLFAYSGLYGSGQEWKNYLQAGQMISLVYMLSLVIGYFYNPKLNPPRSLFFTAWFTSVGLVVGFRLLTTLIWRQLGQNRHPVPVFLIAPANRIPKLARVLQRRSYYQVVGAALAATANTPATLQAILNSPAQEVLVENLPQAELASALYWQLRRAGITLRLVPTSLEMLHRKGIPEVFAGLPTLRVEVPFLSGWDYRLKRWLDLTGAVIGLICLAPLFIGVALAIKLSSPGSIFFRQERVGLHGKTFQLYKFRTMVVNAAELQAALEQQYGTCGQVMFKIKDDPRITSVGRFLRRTSLDELPQLFNVLLGQMSLVGPRPLPLRDVERFANWHHIRHQVLPGMTGLWQVSGRSDIEDFDDAARLDLYYIDNWSLNLDLDILVETLRIVLFGRGAY